MVAACVPQLVAQWRAVVLLPGGPEPGAVGLRGADGQGKAAERAARAHAGQHAPTAGGAGNTGHPRLRPECGPR